MFDIAQLYKITYWVDFSAFLLLPFLALIISYMVGSLAYVSSKGTLRIWVSFTAIALLGLLGSAVVIRMIHVALEFILHSREYIPEKAVFGIPMLIPPMYFILKCTLPEFWRITRIQIRDRHAPLETGSLSLLRSPSFAVPVHALTIGIVMNHFLTVQYLGFSINLATIALAYSLFAVSLSLLWVWQRRRTQKPIRRRSRFIGISMGLLILAIGLWAYFEFGTMSSRLPEKISMSMAGHGHSEDAGHAASAKAVSVTELTGSRMGIPDQQITLTAEKKTVKLETGEVMEAWTYNGQLPGPELRFREGELVKITLVNKDIDDGVTIHWHGLDVPNAEDGVAGLTQEAVMPGESHTYQFRIQQVGSYWYHSHEQSSEQVKKGLFGPLVIIPKDFPSDVLELNIVNHTWETPEGLKTAIGTSLGLQQQLIRPGTKVRLRTINADHYPASYSLIGASSRLAAIDGTEVHGPEEVLNSAWSIGGGGRYDVTFTMPNEPVLLQGVENTGILFSPDGSNAIPDQRHAPNEIDPLTYGRKMSTTWVERSHFDREYQLVLGSKFGFYNGRYELLFTINEKVFPETPTLRVSEGELVKITFVNDSGVPHPMHTHGHRMLVLSRNGEVASGSPWRVDTLNVLPGEIYEVALQANNPGIWMDHCHNLNHAAVGMTMHLAYEGVTTPYEMRPESTR